MGNLSENEKNEKVLKDSELNKVTGGVTRGMVADYTDIVKPRPRKKADENSTPIKPGIFK